MYKNGQYYVFLFILSQGRGKKKKKKKGEVSILVTGAMFLTPEHSTGHIMADQS